MTDINEYPLGTVVDVYGEWDVGVTPTDPSVVTLTVQSPDGTETVYTHPTAEITKTGTGRYQSTINPTSSGLWYYRWLGVGLADGGREGQFYIAQSFVGTDVYTYDPTTQVGEIRLYLDDRDVSYTESLNPRRRSAIFSDAEINVFLTRTGNVFSAAALGLITIASNRALLVQRREIGKTNVDYGDLRSDLLKSAKALQEQAVLVGGDAMAPADGFVEHTWTDASYRDVIWNDARRRTV